MNWILEALINTIRKYETADPFEIAKARHILVRFVPLGQTYGFYLKNARQQVIHINSDIEEYKWPFICSHELCHSLLHPNANTPFLNHQTLLSTAKIECQANIWATFQVLLLNGTLNENYETIQQMLRSNAIPIEMAERILSFPSWPYSIDAHTLEKFKY